jgi:hypothetical protein
MNATIMILCYNYCEAFKQSMMQTCEIDFVMFARDVWKDSISCIKCLLTFATFVYNSINYSCLFPLWCHVKAQWFMLMAVLRFVK